MKKLLIILLLMCSTSCVTKVIKIELKGDNNTINILQKGSEDSLNGNEGKVKIPMPGG